MQKDVDTKQLRSFGLLIGGIFGVIGLWPVVVHGANPRLWALVMMVLLVVPAFILPGSLRLVYQIWMAVGDGLGRVNTKIILGVGFYGVITPTGLALRLLGKDPMRRRFERDAETYRIARQPRPGSDMIRQF